MKAAINKDSTTSSDYSAWTRVCATLKHEYGEATFNSWLNHLSFVNIEGSEVILSAPTRFIRDWILNNYQKKIIGLWRQEDTSITSISITIKPTNNNTNQQPNTTENNKNNTNVDVLNIPQNIAQISSPLDPRFTFDNFIIGDTNKLAFSSAKSIAENTNQVNGNNPLYLHGGVGLGKTHLMHAIALHAKEHTPERKVIYLSAEKFMYEFIKALRSNDIMSFKENFRNVDILMVDDIQFICGKEGTQEEFFHTVNALLDMNKQIIITGDKSPAELEGMKERIKSRLGWGLVADIGKTDFDLRLGILKSKVAHVKNTHAPEQVLEFLASKIKSNVRELEGALNKVVAHSHLMNEKITLQNTQTILCDLLRANEKTLTIIEIQKSVAQYFGIKMTDMSSAKRARNIARPRQIAMYLCKQLTTRSLSEIGRRFGGKDHTTVMHAVKKVIQLMEDDTEFKTDVEKLTNTINQ